MAAERKPLWWGFPKKVWVGTYEFAMCVVPEGHDGLEAAEGMTDTGARKIYIEEGLDRRRAFEVVHHEITHAINWVHDIDDGAAEEAICEHHGKAWTALLIDNPKYLSWVTRTVGAIRQDRKEA